ncbi:hypothetical protein MMC13_007884 [Lambiella insularis]|nr:hypothetical protein [Lambiella insularis]
MPSSLIETADSPTPFPRTVFSCTRLNSSTFLIVENDRYDEHPFIYVKIYRKPSVIVLSDTGCGGSETNALNVPADTLRNFIETFPVGDNGNKPLNPHLHDEPASYMIINTHCHYDHILGIPSFRHSSAVIVASSHDKSFIETDLPKHSLCQDLGVPTPEYVVSYWADDLESIIHEHSSLHIQILHTPGHTPDQLSWFDGNERHLFVGDSFYERVANDKTYTQPIIFPKEGSIVDYMHSLERLVAFVGQKNAEEEKRRVRIGCGHITASADGQEILSEVQKYFWDVIDGAIPVRESTQKRGEDHDLWQEDGEPRFSLMAPRWLITAARRHFEKGPSGYIRPAIA